jgi:hypothetical protein
MARYAVINSNANRLILTALGVQYEVEGQRIIFDWEASHENISSLAETLVRLGYARDIVDAYKLACSFFINKHE